MPYATCPNCKLTFHLNVRVDVLEEWKEKFPTQEDGARYIQCYFCWKELKELDVVEVWRVPKGMEKQVSKGDLGAVVLVQDVNYYEVECVKADGTTKWLETLPRNCLWYKNHGNS
jgi:hypothetical protein